MALTKISNDGVKKPIDLADNEKIQLGTGNDLQIYHDDGNSYIKHAGTGNLRIETAGGTDEDIYLKAKDAIFLQPADGEAGINIAANGAVELYHNNVKKLTTYNTGIEVHGSEGSDGELYLYADEGDDDADNWKLNASYDASRLRFMSRASGSWTTNIECNGNGNVELNYAGSKKFETTANGAKLEGNLYMDDDKEIRLGDSGDFQLFHHNTSGEARVYNSNAAGISVISDLVTFKNNASNKTLLTATNGGAVELYYDNVKTFSTQAAGITVLGGEGGSAQIELFSDEGDDNEDKWRITKESGNHSFRIQNYSTGSWVTGLTIDQSNNATFAGTVSDSKGNLRSIPQRAPTANYTLVADDAGRHVIANGYTITVPNQIFSVGDAITIINNHASSAMTITCSAPSSVFKAGEATAVTSITLNAKGMVTFLCNSGSSGSNSQFFVSGAGMA